MACFYIQLNYEEYKALERAIREYKETEHKTVTGFYHKSIRLPVGDNTMEFHGPIVKSSEIAIDS